MRSRSSRSRGGIRFACARASTSTRSSGRMPDMDDVGSPLSYTAIAERLLAHRLAQPDLSRPADRGVTALHTAFRSLAEVFALDHAAAAGRAPRDMLSA